MIKNSKRKISIKHKNNKVPIIILLFGIVLLVLGVVLIWFGGVIDLKIICIIGAFIGFYGCAVIASYTASLNIDDDDDDGPHFYGPGGTVI